MKNEHQHYYTKSPTSKDNSHVVAYNIGKHSFRFASADGVFSKYSVDYGSNLLVAVVSKQKRPDTLLDIGCGYGVIGIALATIFGTHATMCDINERAVALAKKNTKNVDAAVLQSDGLDSIEGTYDMIVTNPPIRAGKSVYYRWFTDSIDYLNAGGSLYCVIQKKQGAPSAVKHLEGIYGNCEIIAKDKGYYILECVKG